MIFIKAKNKKNRELIIQENKIREIITIRTKKCLGI